MEARDMSWVEFLFLAWEHLAKVEEKIGGPVDCRTIELMYGPAVAEDLIRIHGQAVSRLVPSLGDIRNAYGEAGGSMNTLEAIDLLTARSAGHLADLADRFAAISGDANVAIAARLPLTAQAICILAHTLEPVARQKFQEAFIWNESRRSHVFSDDELDVWRGLELQVGLGILASIWHAKQVVPDLTPEEFAAAILRKYGIPVLVDGVWVYACHWCNTGPCSCGGGKAPTRRVTYEEAARNLHLGPADTQKAMYFAYGWANTARGGAGYGSFRALIEASAEKGVSMIDEETSQDLNRRFGPLYLPQQKYFVEIANRGRDEVKKRNIRNAELTDAAQWQDLYGPGMLDHCAGMQRALEHVTNFCET